MRLRPPATPLITIDPYFSVWADTDLLNGADTVHWTAKQMPIRGYLTVDGVDYRFIGAEKAENEPALTQVSSNVNALSTTYVFQGAGVKLTAVFTSPILPTDFYYLTRPVSYLSLQVCSMDGAAHKTAVKLAVSEQICLDRAGEDEVVTETLTENGMDHIKMGSKSQRMLERSGDFLAIEWGYFYLSAKNATVAAKQDEGMTWVTLETEVNGKALVTFSYDDVKSIEYFGKALPSWWNRNGAKITDEIAKAHAEYETLIKTCDEFSDRLFLDAVRAGGEKYAELLELAFRQTLAAHKLAVDENGEILWISKECFSNGCAATVDVSYPSIPLFLLYNPELVRGMMRPIYKYAASDEWKKELKYDFAPHDAGRYPKVNGQVYGLKNGVLLYEKQMPVEECGNMLIMEAATALADGDASFAASHFDVLEGWVQYLIQNGKDPENQLCTDDFAGHLAHNCNLTLKAIMGIASLGILCDMLGKKEDSEKYLAMARELAPDWATRAANGDGSYRLAFDKPNTFSMKYNIVWDKLFGTEIMPREVIESEVASYRKHVQPYGLPLDSRQPYTKSDWLVWTATLAENRDTFEDFVEPLWRAFHYTPSRVPMTDWYWTLTGEHKAYMSRSYVTGNYDEPVPDKSFRNRTVQGGLFIKLLEYKGTVKWKK
ncbi:MAG: DUF4965 domain-containing protein [Ruminococcaceae bacterium]|nr:DUF4965 domain-containing protein [Oscillospiraceae bacterium]